MGLVGSLVFFRVGLRKRSLPGGRRYRGWLPERSEVSAVRGVDLPEDVNGWARLSFYVAVPVGPTSSYFVTCGRR
jgi:hypothetical protein